MHGLTGTWQLYKTALRLDRLKLPVAIVAVCLLFLLTVSSVLDLYANSPEGMNSYAATSAPSVVARVFAGPLHGPELGSIVLNEGFLFTAIAVAFISTMTVIRHTRQNEENNRTELIGSMEVSRHAPLVASLIVALSANIGIVLGITMTLYLSSGGDLTFNGSLITGLTLGFIGFTFACLAAIAAQLTDGSRSANALCALIIGVSFLLRALGDVFGNVVNNGLGVESTFLSWLSPLGWGQQVYPYSENNLWILFLFTALSLVSIIVASILMIKRDIGSGIFATKPGPSRANKKLLSVNGLASRLQKSTFRGWMIAISVLGFTYGLSLKEFQSFLEDNEEFRQAITSISDNSNVNYIFLSILVSFMAITIVGYVTQSLLRLRGEESSGRIESVLGVSVSRTNWMLSHIRYILTRAIILSTIAAFSIGVTFIITTGTAWSQLPDILIASYTQLVAISAFAGFVIALFAFLPNLAFAVAWAGFASCLVILQLGLAINLPQWVINLSPFVHLPAMPADKFELTPVIGLLIASITLTILGLIKFRKRDLVF